jgi:hypothetical protein
MPLTCPRAGEPFASFLLCDEEWRTIGSNYRAMRLSMRCCSSPAIPKLSSLGTRFFAHKSRSDCQVAPESAEHLLAKFIIADSARAVGWETSAEASGTDPGRQSLGG